MKGGCEDDNEGGQSMPVLHAQCRYGNVEMINNCLIKYKKL